MELTRRSLVAAAACIALPGVRAQDPSKTLKILVGFPAGQATDIVARMLAERLTGALEQPVIVENRPGQGGSVVLGVVAKSPPDGTVMTLSALAGYCVNPHLYNNVPYQTLKDLDPVGTVADLPLALVVNPSVPAKTLPELVAYVKQNPDKLSHPSSGNGTLSHLLMEDFKRRAGVRMLHVPYQGSGKAMTDLVGGMVQVGLDTIAVTLPLVQSGRLRMLAVGTPKRIPTLADVPTIAELGYPGFEAVAWIGLSAPAGTPAPLRERVNAAVQRTLKSPDFVQKLVGIGALPRPGSVAEFGGLLKTEYVRWGRIVRASGVRVD
ncbi:Bug family tripartite tricarboxylate transporter substrate binding protein [Ramlibacter albus]|uniref:Tripartite tricarboxylate transporter substrate binding protein n=1 Tax=Ramlibacter albus TaxID=2079448 RepID=A0A923MBA9_9BURK|nr:tripartite tricarboxylate transporter substrate binding protein [Ramlibacter albus]MBC5766228.1 tripartite tricarboxylate transporter substrate binding protein [Ramlibacter albus]